MKWLYYNWWAKREGEANRSCEHRPMMALLLFVTEEEEKVERFSGSSTDVETYFGPKFCPGLLSSSYNLTFCTLLQRAWWGVLKYVTYTQYLMYISDQRTAKRLKKSPIGVLQQLWLAKFPAGGRRFFDGPIVGKVFAFNQRSSCVLETVFCLRKLSGEMPFFFALKCNWQSFPD